MNEFAKEVDKLLSENFKNIKPGISQHMMDSMLSYDVNIMANRLEGNKNAGDFVIISTIHIYGLVAAAINILGRMVKSVECMHENNEHVSKQDCDEAVEVIIKRFWGFFCKNLNAQEHGTLGFRLSQLSAEQMAKHMPTAEDVANAVATAFAKGEAAAKKDNGDG